MSLGTYLACLFRPLKPADITDVTFPVLVLQPDGASPFLVTIPDDLFTLPYASARQPLNDTILIDSNFNPVHRKKREIQRQPTRRHHCAPFVRPIFNG